MLSKFQTTLFTMDSIVSNFLFLCLACIIWIITPSTASSHPLDITFTTAYYHKNTLQCELTMHPYEASYLLKKNSVDGITFTDFYASKNLFFDYIRHHLKFFQQGNQCTFHPKDIATVDEAEMYSTGLPIRFSVRCPSTIDLLNIQADLFIQDFQLQTNKVIFLPTNFETMGSQVEVNEVIFTARVAQRNYYVQSNHLNLGNNDKDTDGDSLPDSVEQLYGTNPTQVDTDNDGFQDWLELSYGFDPNSKEPSPGQRQVAAQMGVINEMYSKNPDPTSLQQEWDGMLAPLPASKKPVASTSNNEWDSDTATQTYEDTSQESANQKSSRPLEAGSDDYIRANMDHQGNTVIQLGRSKNDDEAFDFDRAKALRDSEDPFKAKQLGWVLSSVKTQFENGGFFSMILIILIVMFLGFLHALEAGHGKTVVISYLLDEKRSYRQALFITGTISITHVLDIIVLGSLFAILTTYVEAFQKMEQTIMLVAKILLVGIALFLLIQALLKTTRGNSPKPTELETSTAEPKDPSKKPARDAKSSIILGFLTGLAPCPFGWGLFFFLVSIGKTTWIIPLTLVFGIGIWICLIIFAYITVFSKGKLFQRYHPLMKWSPTISASMMLLFGCILLFFNRSLLFLA